MSQFYEDEASLFVEAYDAFYDADLPQIAGDVTFYSDIAREVGGSILELACGTGRITLALAEAGLAVTGADCSEGMLSVARRKAAALPAEAQQRLELVHQDMTTLRLDRQFNFVFVPFRSFQFLLTGDLQRRALESIHRHLGPGGTLALHLFDPRLDLLIDDHTPMPEQ